MDWALIQDEAKQFENFVISSLVRSATTWSDLGLGQFEVCYVRNVLSQEADFLLTKEGKPWIIGDIQLSQTSIAQHLYQMSKQLGDLPILQITKKSGIFQTPQPHALIISADRLLTLFP